MDWYLEDDSLEEFGYYTIPFQEPDSLEGPDKIRGYAPDPFYVSHLKRLPDSVLTIYQGKRVAWLHPGNYDLFIGIGFPIHLSLNNSGPVADTFYHYTGEYKYGPDYYAGCGEITNGELLSRYYDGKIRMSATFKNGWISDTMRYYYPSGQLYELTIPDGKSFRRIRYRENGMIQSEYDDKRGLDKRYNASGQLTFSHNSKGEGVYYTYHTNGKLKAAAAVSEKRVYNVDGILQETVRKRQTNRQRRNDSGSVNYTWEIGTYSGKPDKQMFMNAKNISFQADHRTLVKEGCFTKVIIRQNGKKSERYILSDDVHFSSYKVYTRKGLFWKKKTKYRCDCITAACRVVASEIAYPIETKNRAQGPVQSTVLLKITRCFIIVVRRAASVCFSAPASVGMAAEPVC